VIMVVHDLDHLDFSAPPGKRLAVLGDPISHSLSPAMHNAALRQMAQTDPGMAEWRYEAVHVAAVDLPKALPRLHAAGVVGVNLTIPHKVHVLDIINEVDATALRMGAVNTLVRTDTGYRGSNTDGFGILKALDEALGREVAGADIWLFGAGGAARGIIVACMESGAGRLTIVNRSRERLLALRDDLDRQSMPGSERIRYFDLTNTPLDADDGAILINATSLGLKGTDPNPIDHRFLVGGNCVYDTTYGSVNQLARDCGKRNIPYADGLSMLVWQGVRSLEIWTNKPVSAEHMREAAERELEKRKSNG